METKIKGKWMHLNAFIHLPTGDHKAQFIREADDKFMELLACLTHEALKHREIPATRTALDLIKCNTPEEAKKVLLHDHQMGGGFWDTLKSVGNRVLNVIKGLPSARIDFSPQVKKLLSEVGNIPIDKMTICRDPIVGILNKITDVISLGATKAYDSIYHLYLLLEIGGKSYVLEKNHVIEFKQANKEPKETFKLQFPETTTNELLRKTEAQMGKEKFFLYEAFSNNCQVFISNILSANEINQRGAQAWVMQNVFSQNDPRIKLASKVSNSVTDLAARFDRALYGGEL